jgi:hypothetical protein
MPFFKWAPPAAPDEERDGHVRRPIPPEELKGWSIKLLQFAESGDIIISRVSRKIQI